MSYSWRFVGFWALALAESRSGFRRQTFDGRPVLVTRGGRAYDVRLSGGRVGLRARWTFAD